MKNTELTEAQKMVQIGIKKVKAKQYKEALKYLLKADKLKPDSFSIKIRLGRCFKNLNKNNQALKYYLKAYKINPKDLLILETIGYHYLTDKTKKNNKNKFKKALKYFEEAGETENKKYKDTKLSYFNLDGLGYCYNELKQYEKALKCYLRMNKIEPNDLFIIKSIAKGHS